MADAIELWVKEGIEPVMQGYNKKKPKKEATPKEEAAKTE